MNVQQIASIARQVAAVAAVVMGILTQALSGIKLPTAISTAMTIAGAAILAIEHYVGDPSTGLPTLTPTASPTAAPAPLPTFTPAPQQQQH